MLELEDAVLPGCRAIIEFLEEEERDEEIEPYRRRHDELATKREEAKEERASIQLDDRYLPHGLDDETLASILEQLAGFREVTEAWLIRRDVEYYPEKPLFVLGMKRCKALPEWWSKQSTEERDGALQRRVADALDFEAECFLPVLNHRGKEFFGIFSQVPGSKILPE